MAYTELTMTAVAVPSLEETCEGCNRAFRRGERMNGVRYSTGDPAGWHCDECVRTWQDRGEDALPQWAARIARRVGEGS